MENNPTKNDKIYPCPCCGYLTFTDPPGSYEICSICNWEDEDYQLDDPEAPDGANHNISLEQAQDNFEKFGASLPQRLPYVRKATENDKRDPQWRKYNRAIDKRNLKFAGTNIERYYWRR